MFFLNKDMSYGMSLPKNHGLEKYQKVKAGLPTDRNNARR
jgi:hypothetical protein